MKKEFQQIKKKVNIDNYEATNNNLKNVKDISSESPTV